MTTDEDHHDDDDELGSRHLCAVCIGERYLRAEVQRTGREDTCFYCGGVEVGLSVEEIADHIEGAFERHYTITPAEASSLEYTMMKEGGRDWEREGEPARYAIANAAEISDEPAEDIREFLAERHYDMELARMGEEGPFDDDVHYAESGPNDIEFRESWRFFENSLKKEARFFSTAAEATFAELFEGLHGHKNYDGRPVVVDAGPGTELSAIYRARVFYSTEKLEEALAHPNRHLGPPPSELAPAGRMNARGISVFYGAINPDTAIGETRPPVGSRVLLGRFEFLRPVRLLDVSALRSIYVQGSIFDPGHLRRLKLAKFLERLSERFAMPVMPNDEPLDYLPTQAIADYLANRIDPALDGVLYPSVQADGVSANLALFHKSARVEAIALPQGTKIDTATGFDSEDGRETDYWVWEEVPPKRPESEKKTDEFPVFDDILAKSLRADTDMRDPAIRVDTSSLQVHHIRATQFRTESYSVHRHRKQR